MKKRIPVVIFRLIIKRMKKRGYNSQTSREEKRNNKYSTNQKKKEHK